MSADEAVKAYGLIKTKYNPLFNNKDSEKVDVSVYYAPGYDLARYRPRTEKTTQLYYNNDIFAVGFHLRNPALSLDKVMGKLRKDFNKEFVEKKTDVDRQITYYELNVNDCEIITVDDNPDNAVGNTYAIHVIFTYKLIPPEVQTLLETRGMLWHDD